MPALIWVAFWSCMMGAATCWQQPALAPRVAKPNRRDPNRRDLNHRDPAAR
jgi:hypothetical protein